MNRDEIDEDIETEITSGDQIQLESYKSIPEFSGLRGTYRPWRNQVARRMKIIDAFKTHPKYEAALAIIRAKITGDASNVLTNNKTAYNIIAILTTLDSAYADQRPLYAVEAEMTSIKQWNKTLQTYHDVINQALNLVITKVVMTYKEEAEQRSLIAEAQQKAVRTFIVGLNSQMTRHILYGRIPKSLAEAYSIAQTVYYDNQHLQLESNHEIRSQNNIKKQQKPMNTNYNKPQQQQNQPNSQTSVIKGNGDSNRQQFQQSQRVQRINQLVDDEFEVNEESQPITEDVVSNSSLTSDNVMSSAFLDE